MQLRAAFNWLSEIQHADDVFSNAFTALKTFFEAPCDRLVALKKRDLMTTTPTRFS